MTYTQSLLSSPPPGVVYEPYDEAMRRGVLREHGRRAAFLESWARGRRRVRETALLAGCRAVDRFRRWRLLPWEPFRFFSVEPGEYDLIHIHVFGVGFIGPVCPFVVSCGGPMDWLYTDARQYSLRRVAVMKRLERVVARMQGVARPAVAPPAACAALTYTAEAKRWLEDATPGRGCPVHVVPTCLPDAPRRSASLRPRRIGFVGRDFLHKGGDIVIQAYRLLRQRGCDYEMVLVGSEVKLPADLERDNKVTNLAYVPRSVLLEQMLPTLDVLAYPTRYDYLPSFTLLEAMSRGVPIVGTDYRGMRDVLGGMAGIVCEPEDPASLARCLEQALHPEANRQYSLGAYERFGECFSTRAVREKLGDVYRTCIGSQRTNEPVMPREAMVV